MATTHLDRVLPPLGLDPERHLLQRESLARVLAELRGHRYGEAFATHAIEGRPWSELAVDLGVEANTLTKAWKRWVERMRCADVHLGGGDVYPSR